MIVKIVAVGKIPREFLAALKSKIENNLVPTVEILCSDISLDIPPEAFNSLRKQYDANIILKRVLSVSGERVLAVTAQDLYTSSRDLNFIFGQAQCPGRAALISLYRLRPIFYGGKHDPNLLLERATKEAVHELGHTFGLDHCPNPSCVMCFSNSIRDVDRKRTTFCESCRRKLVR